MSTDLDIDAAEHLTEFYETTWDALQARILAHHRDAPWPYPCLTCVQCESLISVRRALSLWYRQRTDGQGD
jgi:hypothetical protein